MRHIRRLLIANRGEIALRIIRTCRRLGIESVLVVSDADLDSVPARVADRCVRLSGSHAGATYLSIERVIAAARQSAVDAIHPGYGFLSENAGFADACAAHDIVFVGPTVAQLDAFGDKLKARSHALAADVSPVPGGDAKTPEEARAMAEKLGYPVLIKAVGGGGGRGMKPVLHESELDNAFNMAVSEAQAAFNDPRVYMETYVEHGRHVEVQILGDGQTVIHLGTRDCSVQRRYQKLVEEAPAPMLPDDIREGLHAAAVRLGESVAYRGLGTAEFLVDLERNAFYFLELNARIQVEHPVTEMICGLDLVEEQIRVAEGQPLRFTQQDISFAGHAIECRLNAEDWRQDFRPDPGTLQRAAFPIKAGVRVDSHMQSGATITPFYDSMVAKLIVHAADREGAVTGMAEALANSELKGVKNTIGLHQALMMHPDFRAGGISTRWFPGVFDTLLSGSLEHG